MATVNGEEAEFVIDLSGLPEDARRAVRNAIELNIPDEARQRALSGPLCESVTWRQLDEILGLAAPLIVAAELARIAETLHSSCRVDDD